MILKYYTLREQPFGSTPDPRYFYSSETHREALASLLYGIEEGRGFLALIAPPGMGKTTLLFRCLDQLQHKLRTIFLFQTICTPIDFLRLLLTDLGVEDVSGGIAELQSRLIRIVMEQSAAGVKLVIVVDEAQNLDNATLELIRMLSNFETSQQKLMHIILCGQPQLARRLAAPELLQLRQRISIIARLAPFTPEQTAEYVSRRLEVAGWSGPDPLFERSALEMIAAHSGGLPRNINNLCFNALSLGCVLRKKSIDAEVMGEVIGDLEIEPLGADPAPPPAMAAELQPLPAAPTAVSRVDPALTDEDTSPAPPWRWVWSAAAATVLIIALSGVIAPAPRATASRVSPSAVLTAAHAAAPAPVQAPAPTAAPSTAGPLALNGVQDNNALGSPAGTAASVAASDPAFDAPGTGAAPAERSAANGPGTTPFSEGAGTGAGAVSLARVLREPALTATPGAASPAHDKSAASLRRNGIAKVKVRRSSSAEPSPQMTRAGSPSRRVRDAAGPVLLAVSDDGVLVPAGVALGSFHRSTHTEGVPAPTSGGGTAAVPRE